MSVEDPRSALAMERLGAVVGRNLQRVRSARGMSLSALARDSGVARATLYQLEAGSGNPTLDTLFAVTSVLGVALSELVNDSDPPSVQIIRSDEGASIRRPGVEARLLRRFATGAGVIEMYDLRLERDRVTEAHEHPAGVFEHVLLTSGRIRTGPVADAVELQPGDYISFRADTPHIYEAMGADARATLLMHYPPAMSSRP